MILLCFIYVLMIKINLNLKAINTENIVSKIPYHYQAIVKNDVNWYIPSISKLVGYLKVTHQLATELVAINKYSTDPNIWTTI